MGAMKNLEVSYRDSFDLFDDDAPCVSEEDLLEYGLAMGLVHIEGGDGHE